MTIVCFKPSMFGLAAATALLGAAMGSASAQAPKPVTFAPDANGQIAVVLPQHKVMCTFTPKEGTRVYQPTDGPELSCDRVEPKYVRVVVNAKTVKRFDKVGDQDTLGVDNPLPNGS